MEDEARINMVEENTRNPRQQPISIVTIPDPGSITFQLSSSDLAGLKRKYDFLQEFSDDFIRHAGVDTLVKAEATNRKLKEFEKNKRAEDKLSFNRENLPSSTVPAGEDNRLDVLHPGRVLPGATCSAGKLWLHARACMGNKPHPALSTYDMVCPLRVG